LILTFVKRKELAEKRGDSEATENEAKKVKPIPPPPAPGETARGINQAKLEFKLLEDDDNNFVIDLACGKYPPFFSSNFLSFYSSFPSSPPQIHHL
jgi:hypothetical protein